MILTSIAVFVLQQYEKLSQVPSQTEAIECILKIKNYTEFLLQPLSLGMFVPVDDQGNVLVDPVEYAYTKAKNAHDQYQYALKYNEANGKVILKGFKYRKDDFLGCDYVESDEFQLNVTLKKGLYWLDSSDAFYDFVLHGDTIESLSNVGLKPELTESAIKNFQ